VGIKNYVELEITIAGISTPTIPREIAKPSKDMEKPKSTSIIFP